MFKVINRGIATITLLLTVGCGEHNNIIVEPPTVFAPPQCVIVRLKNLSAYDFTTLTVETTSIEPVAKGETSNTYILDGTIDSDLFIRTTIDGVDFVLYPVNDSNAPLLESGNYLIELNVKDYDDKLLEYELKLIDNSATCE